MDYRIPFNRPPHTGKEDQYVLEAMKSSKLSGDGRFGLRCQEWLKTEFDCASVLLTPSCTQALELAAMLIGIKPDDEVIMPSYTFVSTANAFAVRGAKIVFVDIDPSTMNIDAAKIEAAITPRTKAVVPVHYGGVSASMHEICGIAESYDLRVVEDAAQGILAKYKDRPQGSYGDLSTLSFHETKNITSGGEGGALIINNPEFVDRAEIIREKGTNRSQFFRGMVDKYSWVDLGSSYLPSEIQAAYLWGQIQCIGEIAKSRLGVWEFYDRGLRPLAEDFGFSVPNIPVDRIHNAHMYYLKVNDLEERSALIRFLGQQGVQAVFHYVPLHSSPAGRRYSRFHGVDTYTTRESERLVRLPLWYGMREAECDYVIQSVSRFYSSRDK